MYGGGQRISEKFNPYDEREDQYEQRKGFSDFRNSSKSTQKYLRSCLKTAIEALHKQGASKKEVKIQVEQITEAEYPEDEEDEQTTEKAEHALKQMQYYAHRFQNSPDHSLRCLGRGIEAQLEEITATSNTPKQDDTTANRDEHQ